MLEICVDQLSQQGYQVSHANERRCLFGDWFKTLYQLDDVSIFSLEIWRVAFTWVVVNVVAQIDSIVRRDDLIVVKLHHEVGMFVAAFFDPLVLFGDLSLGDALVDCCDF